MTLTGCGGYKTPMSIRRRMRVMKRPVTIRAVASRASPGPVAPSLKVCSTVPNWEFARTLPSARSSSLRFSPARLFVCSTFTVSSCFGDEVMVFSYRYAGESLPASPPVANVWPVRAAPPSGPEAYHRRGSCAPTNRGHISPRQRGVQPYGAAGKFLRVVCQPRRQTLTDTSPGHNSV